MTNKDFRTADHKLYHKCRSWIVSQMLAWVVWNNSCVSGPYTLTYNNEHQWYTNLKFHKKVCVGTKFQHGVQKQLVLLQCSILKQCTNMPFNVSKPWALPMFPSSTVLRKLRKCHTWFPKFIYLLTVCAPHINRLGTCALLSLKCAEFSPQQFIIMIETC